MSLHLTPLAMPLATVSSWLIDHGVWLVVGAVVAILLALFGRADLGRFSWKRVWAISGVCFAESIRRRVLWLIPLAIVGLVAIIQLQQPADEQDAIRQTTKFCLMASGLVVVLTTLILACTNLPREIESRVIFTVVTKPTTRLEIVLGKVVGFARVSFTILLVMGLFTWGYLHLRAFALTRDLRARLGVPGAVEPISRPTFQHYVDAGLLNAKTLADPISMNVFGRPPDQGTKRRYLNPDGYLLVPFVLPDNLVAYADPEGKETKLPGMRLSLRLGYDPAPPTAPAPTTAAAATAAARPPLVAVQVFDPNVQNLLTPQQVANGPVALPSPDGKITVTINVPPNPTSQLAHMPFVFVAISTAAGANPLWTDEDPGNPASRVVQLDVPVIAGAGVTWLHLSPVDPIDHAKTGQLVFTGREGTFGQQLKGDPRGASQTCVYQFRGVNVAAAAKAGGDVPIEMRAGIEKSGDVASDDVLTDVRLTVTDAATGQSVDLPGSFHPENNRTMYGAIPAAACGTGDFDVAVRCYNGDQWVGLKPNSLSVVESDASFGLNLFKQLWLILWMLSVLVTAVSGLLQHVPVLADRPSCSP